MSSTQGTARIARPAVVRPITPTSRRPHPLPHRRMITSENDPPTRQATTPKANGSEVSQPVVSELEVAMVLQVSRQQASVRNCR